jgi:hypothetical protein
MCTVMNTTARSHSSAWGASGFIFANASITLVGGVSVRRTGVVPLYDATFGASRTYPLAFAVLDPHLVPAHTLGYQLPVRGWEAACVHEQAREAACDERTARDHRAAEGGSFPASLSDFLFSFLERKGYARCREPATP